MIQSYINHSSSVFQMGNKSKHKGEVLSCSKLARVQMKYLVLRVTYSRDYKVIVSMNDIDNHGGYLTVWQTEEKQRQGSPSWNEVVHNSGQYREIIIYFFT